MAYTPMVAIIGRPNVGKSSLFNVLIKERVAIEEPTEGVTRDRLIRDVQLGGRRMQLVDTGGIGVVDRQDLEGDVDEQIQFAMGSADLLIFVVDGQNDPTDLDRKVARRLHGVKVPILLVSNKADNDQIEYEQSRFLSLGFGEPMSVSVLHHRGLAFLIKKMVAHLPPVRDGKEDDQNVLRIALSGRRNVGKSSLTNLLCGEKRVIVSDRAGTTRDAIDVRLKWGEMEVVLVDTAGLRKKNQTEDSIEFFSVNRTFGALYRADMGLLLIDAEQGVSQVDQKLAAWYAEHKKPCVIVVNKWDLAKDVTDQEEYGRYLADRLPGIAYAPVVYISVLESQGIGRLNETIEACFSQMHQELTTARINDVLQKAQDQRRPKRHHGTIPKLFYSTQVKQRPPTFLIFGKSTQQIDDNYRRYLAQFFRKNLGLTYLPVHFVFRNRDSRYASS